MIEKYNNELTWFERRISIPLSRKVIEPIKIFYYDLIHLPGNIKKWGYFVLKDRDWDGVYTLEALRIKCIAQHKSLCRYGSSVDSRVMAKESLELSIVISNIIEKGGDYITDDEHDRVYVKKVNSFEALMRLRSIRAKKDYDKLKEGVSKIMNWWD